MLVAMVVMTLAAMAQSNPKVSYQSVVRDENNRLVANQEVTVKVEVLDANDAVLYTETQTVTSNANGLVSLMIGGTDEFTTLDWANAQFATTVTVGNYQVMDTVPVVLPGSNSQSGLTVYLPVYSTSTTSWFTAL